MIDIKSIWANQLPSGDLIIKTKIDQIHQFNCFAATNHITGNLMFIIKVSGNLELYNFKKLKFKGVKIELFDYVEYRELIIYLLNNDLKDIFSYFIEDILNEVKFSTTEIEALNKTSNIILKWKSLFDRVIFSGLSLEQQKGLIGEILFINKLLDFNYTIDRILESWTGIEYENKDFMFGSNGFEVKFTSSKNPAIKISSERQLDDQNLNSLYLVLYIAEEVKENGDSLNTIIKSTRDRIDFNQNALLKFNELLSLVGYKEDDIENYNTRYAIKKINYYLVGAKFPKIVPLDLQTGIYNSSYYIEISACEHELVDESAALKTSLNG